MKNFKSEPEKSVLVIVVGFVIIYIAKKWEWVLYAAAVVGALSFLSRWVALKVEMVWFKLAKLLGLIMPNIFMSVIYYLFLCPIAWMSKLGSRDGLQLKKPNASAWKTREDAFEKESLEKTW